MKLIIICLLVLVSGLAQAKETTASFSFDSIHQGISNLSKEGFDLKLEFSAGLATMMQEPLLHSTIKWQRPAISSSKMTIIPYGKKEAVKITVPEAIAKKCYPYHFNITVTTKIKEQNQFITFDPGVTLKEGSPSLNVKSSPTWDHLFHRELKANEKAEDLHPGDYLSSTEAMNYYQQEFTFAKAYISSISFNLSEAKLWHAKNSYIERNQMLKKGIKSTLADLEDVSDNKVAVQKFIKRVDAIATDSDIEKNYQALQALLKEIKKMDADGIASDIAEMALIDYEKFEDKFIYQDSSLSEIESAYQEEKQEHENTINELYAHIGEQSQALIKFSSIPEVSLVAMSGSSTTFVIKGKAFHPDGTRTIIRVGSNEYPVQFDAEGKFATTVTFYLGNNDLVIKSSYLGREEVVQRKVHVKKFDFHLGT